MMSHKPAHTTKVGLVLAKLGSLYDHINCTSLVYSVQQTGMVAHPVYGLILRTRQDIMTGQEKMYISA